MRSIFFLISFSGLFCRAETDLRDIRFTVRPDFAERSIRVVCEQEWEFSHAQDSLKLLFYPQFSIDSLIIDGQPAGWKRGPHSVTPGGAFSPGTHRIRFVYHGIPQVAETPPWKGGFVWTSDPARKPWLTLACQQEGAQLWWPAPERYDDKPDRCRVTCIYPRNLFFKGNGRMVEDRTTPKFRITAWEVTYPIHPYNITLNIGDYVHLADTLIRRDGSLLRLDYYPLRSNREKAARQFRQVKPMLDCFELNFGKYPYERDGFSVVETPYAGMEHQSAIAYGNGYTDGYKGQDYSGIGLDFDFILIHESAHEWWGNAVSARTRSDFWLQEAFCTFAEYTYVQCRYGEAIAKDYINGKKRLVKNKAAILDSLDSGTDMYTKGALMLFTLKNLIDNEAYWKELLNRFSMEYRYKSISTSELIQWYSRNTGRNLEGFFKQYLQRADIPVLEISTREEQPGTPELQFRISNAVEGFQMPVFFSKDGRMLEKVIATGNWQSPAGPIEGLSPDVSSGYFSVQISN